jgi:large subunit ribosomal protein L30e
MADIIAEIKKYVKENKLAFGKETTMKLLRNKGITRVFLASNCPSELMDDVNHYAPLADVEIVELPITNEELGNICKKPFAIVMMGLLK